MNLAILPEAELEAAEAAIWYDDQRSGLGDEFATEFRFAVEQIHDAPTRYAVVEAYRGQHDVRRMMMRRFPYLVNYLIRPDAVIIVAVSHVRRRPLYWLERLY